MNIMLTFMESDTAR